MEPGYTFRYFEAPPIVEPNRVTGVGRGKFRPLSRKKTGDQKKRQHRKMAKKSKRLNRR
jgi:hypothetical protein